MGYLESMLLPSYFPAVLPVLGTVSFTSRPPGPPWPCWVVSRSRHLLALLLKEWHLRSKLSPLKYKVHVLYSRRCVSSSYPEITHFIHSSCKLDHLVSQFRMNYKKIIWGRNEKPTQRATEKQPWVQQPACLQGSCSCSVRTLVKGMKLLMKSVKLCLMSY